MKRDVVRLKGASERPVEFVGHEDTYQHDCERCVYLGSTTGGKTYDLYFCLEMEKYPIVLARYGDEGAEYTSGLSYSYGMSAPLTLARLAAIERGLLEGE
jgi:hypothetical protein